MVDRASVLLLVRRFGDLAQVRGQLSAFWAILNRHAPGNVPDGLLGVWIDEETLANVPTELTLPRRDEGPIHVRVRETAGVSGIWMLCWLDAPAERLSRADLVSALMIGGVDARFLPVYPHDADPQVTERDWQELQARHADRVLPPTRRLDEAAQS